MDSQKLDHKKNAEIRHEPKQNEEGKVIDKISNNAANHNDQMKKKSHKPLINSKNDILLSYYENSTCNQASTQFETPEESYNKKSTFCFYLLNVLFLY